jgi:uncharacterized repeat protein (TIGR02543 family)
MMSRNRLAGIIVACAIVIVVVIVLFVFKPWEGPASTQTYMLTTAVNPSGTGSVSPSGGQYESGVQVTITASPASGYTFDYWSGSVSGTSPTINITMNHDYSITANFVAATVDRYDLTISSTEGGSVTGPGEGSFTYDAGTVVHLLADAEEGYQFVNWTGNVGTIDHVYDAAPTITMDADHSVTANFEAIPVTQYTLIISSTEGGSVTGPGEGTFTYDEGTVVDLVAQAEQGYQFVSWSGEVGTIAATDNTVTSITVNGDYAITANFAPYMVAAGSYHTVGLKTDGTVVAVGDNSYGQRNVNGWTNIIQIAAGPGHTVGLKSDGTVVAVGDTTFGRCNVEGWTGIVQIAAGGYHTVGLRADGTVVGVGRDGQGQQNFGSWTGIVQVAAGEVYTAGLKSDGTVVITGSCACDVSGWTGITQIAAGPYHVVGLKSDGTVVAVGDTTFGRCNVEGWTGIVQVAAGGYHTVGLRADGTVVGVGRDGQGQQNFGSWTGIVQVAAGEVYTVGLKSNGTAVLTGSCACDVSGWDLIP